jgi:hypothetical protein
VWGIVRHGALRKGWHARIVRIRAGMWHVISFRRSHIGIVDKSRVLGRGVSIDLGNCCYAE